MDSRKTCVAQSVKRLLVAVFTSFISIQTQAAEFIPEYNAVYYVEKLDNIVGRATYKLEHTESGLHYSQHVELVGLAALFMNDEIREDSWLKYRNEKLLLEKYQYLHKGTKDNRNVILDVTWEPDNDRLHGRVRGTSEGKTVELPVDTEIRDALSFQLSMMVDAGKGSDDFEYSVLSKGELKEYRFRKTGTEQLQIDNKAMETIQIERRHGEYLTRLWLAPELHYIPVKVERLENGKVDSRMTLDKINFADKLSSL